MMAWQLKNTIKLSSNPGLQFNDYMPRRRKRHSGKMSLMLLIFVSCCLTLILSPLHAQANDLNSNTTSKGENMLSNDLQSHQHKEGETNRNADKTNDNGTFKRLQTATGTKMANKRAEESKEEEDEDEHSTEVIEMIQPTHSLRHQEHYKQRILLAEKHKQQNQHLDGITKTDSDADGDDDDDDDDEAEEGDGVIEEQERELLQYNRNLRYQQIQQALREPIASAASHHRRHEHHLAVKQHWGARQMELAWPQQQQQQHHLRHQHHHHHQQQQQHQPTQEFQHRPQLRHLKHEMRKQNITDKKSQPILHQRYFDRESSFNYPMTTEGPPHLRHWQPVANSHNPHNRLYNDEGHNNHQEEGIKRFSLPLHGHENENANKEKQTLQQHISGHDEGDDEGDSALNADSDTDYSYEDDDDQDDDDDDGGDDDNERKKINKPNNYPYLTSHTKTNVKRYTNPHKQLLKPFSSFSTATANQQRQQNAGHHLRHTPARNIVNIFKSNSNNDNGNYNKNNNNDDDEYDDDNDDDENDGIEKNEDDIANSPGLLEETSSDGGAGEDGDDDDDKMSDEKWNKIEHEHYRKQLQHQRAMQALRSRRPQNDNTQQHLAAAAAAPITATTATTTALNNNKYSSYSPSSLSAASTTAHNAAWKKRQTINENENDNIYSRYYVPGSVTRKKEEELGSPTAILESRRQFALQQRQNKALASAHHRRIVTEGFCRLPQPRVERIRRDSWKIYTPHCTILHRCADDAGCCPSERQTCAPKRTKNVDLYFFVISLNETQGSIEKLTFVNHTECHCINRSKQRAPEYASGANKDLIAFNNQIPYLRRATILNCFCPNLFEKILQEDGYCRCDCSSGNMGCDWLKRGMEHFSMNDRKCIIEGRCKLPTCEYGQYIKKHGRCPRREERHLSADIEW